MAPHPESLARQFRQSVPGRAPTERPTERDARVDAFVEGCGARRVVATQTDPPHADAPGVEVAPCFDEVDDCLHWHFVIAANGEVVLRFALTRPFENERRHSARQKR